MNLRQVAGSCNGTTAWQTMVRSDSQTRSASGADTPASTTHRPPRPTRDALRPHRRQSRHARVFTTSGRSVLGLRRENSGPDRPKPSTFGQQRHELPALVRGQLTRLELGVWPPFPSVHNVPPSWADCAARPPPRSPAARLKSSPPDSPAHHCARSARRHTHCYLTQPSATARYRTNCRRKPSRTDDP
jgi:hypothetical protein